MCGNCLEVELLKVTKLWLGWCHCHRSEFVASRLGCHINSAPFCWHWPFQPSASGGKGKKVLAQCWILDLEILRFQRFENKCLIFIENPAWDILLSQDRAHWDKISKLTYPNPIAQYLLDYKLRFSVICVSSLLTFLSNRMTNPINYNSQNTPSCLSTWVSMVSVPQNLFLKWSKSPVLFILNVLPITVKNYIFLIFLCVQVFCLHECLCSAWRRGRESSRTGVTNNSEQPCGCWESNLASLQEHPVLLAVVPSLQPQELHLQSCEDGSVAEGSCPLIWVRTQD